MKTILVVDDSKTARLTLKRKLDLLQDVHVEMADSGEAAIELLSHSNSVPPDLIFMDVLMGNVSGYEAAATILKNPAMADVPIVMCTSKDAQEDRDEAARNGAKGFIIKPISDEALEQVVRDLLLNRVRAAPSATQATPVAAVAEVKEALPQEFVISAELEALVRQVVEQSNLQRAEEASSKVANEMASQVVHAALSEHLLQVEDILEGKISILTSSLAALHSAQDQAHAEYKNALATMPQTGGAVDEGRIATLVTHQLEDFEAQEHSKRAIHELDLQTKLEQSLPNLAEQAAQSAAERLINQAMGSHFAMMDDKLQAITAEIAALKSAPQADSSASTAPQFDEQAMLAQLEQLLERRINEALPELVTSQINTQLSAHIAASEDKLFAIEEELHSAIESVAKTGASQSASPVAASLPAEWAQELLAKQDEMLEQRFNAWSEQMDAHITKSEHAMFDRIDDQMNALSLRAAAAAESTHPSAAGKPQSESSTTKLALGVAALGVVLALIALFI